MIILFFLILVSQLISISNGRTILLLLQEIYQPISIGTHYRISLYDSDHFPIIIKSQIDLNSNIQSNIQHWKYKKADGIRFRSEVDNKTKQLGTVNLPSDSDISSLLDEFNQIIICEFC